MPTGTIVEAEIAFLADQRAQNHSPDTIEHYVWTFIDLHRFLNDSGRSTVLDPALIGPLAPAESFKPFRVLHDFLAGAQRDAACTVLTTATFQAFHTWLVTTPIKKPFRGSTCVGYQPRPQRDQQDLPGRQPRLPLHFLVGRHPRRSQPQRVGTISGRPSSTA